MAEEDFEIYLSLLSRFLRISPKQRREIADELRDHLEERCEALVDQGVARVEAVRLALDEFGEAADLAQHFAQIAALRKRRRLMRWSLGSIVVVASLVLCVIAYWPETSSVVAPTRAVAETQVADSSKPKLPFVSSEADANAQTEAKLGKPVESVEFVDTPLNDVFAWLSDQVDIDVLVDSKSLDEEGVAVDAPVSLTIKHTSPAARTVLNLVLEPNGLAYRLRDGIVYVQTQVAVEDVLEVRAYDCHDLVAGTTGEQSVIGMTTHALSSVRADSSDDQAQAGPASKNVPKHRPQPATDRSIESLMNVLQNSTSGPWMEVDGTGGTITAFGSILVIRQTQSVHREVAELLDRLRETNAGHNAK